MANDVGVVGDYVELGVGYLDVPGLFLLLGLFEFLVVSGEHLVANDFVGDYVLFLGDSWLGLLVLELMVMPNYLLMALLEFGVVVSLELFVELEVAVSLEFFVSPVEVGSGRGAYRPCQEGGDLARKEVSGLCGEPPGCPSRRSCTSPRSSSWSWRSRWPWCSSSRSARVGGPADPARKETILLGRGGEWAMRRAPRMPLEEIVC